MNTIGDKEIIKCISVSITKFDDSRAKNSFKGNFDCKVHILTKMNFPIIFEIRNCSYFDTGSKKFVLPPDKKRKNAEGKYERECFYFYIIEGKEAFDKKTVEAVERFLSEKNQPNLTENRQIPKQESFIPTEDIPF